MRFRPILFTILLAAVLPVILPAAEPAPRLLAFPREQSWNYVLSIDQTLDQTILGQRTVTQTAITWHMTWSSIGMTAASTGRVRVRFDALEYTQKSPVGELHFDSREGTEPQDALLAGLNSMVGGEVLLVMNRQGRVVATQNLNVLFTRAVEVAGEKVEDLQRDVVNDVLMTHIARFAETFSLMTNVLPEQPVAPRHTWDRASAQAYHYPILVETVMALAVAEPDFVQIDLASIVTSDTAREDERTDGLFTSYRSTGNESGVFLLDPATNWVISGRIEQKIEGTMEFRNLPATTRMEPSPYMAITMFTFERRS